MSFRQLSMRILGKGGDRMSMLPLYDSNSELVAWLKLRDGIQHIFDTDLNWIAFVKNGNIRSAD